MYDDNSQGIVVRFFLLISGIIQNEFFFKEVP